MIRVEEAMRHISAENYCHRECCITSLIYVESEFANISMR